MKQHSALLGAGRMVCLGLVLSGCAQASDVSDLRSQVDALTARVDKISHGAGAPGDQGGSQLADMESRLDNQKLRIARLRDRVSRTDHRLDQLMNQIESQNASMKAAAAAPPALPPPPAVSSIAAPPKTSAPPAPVLAPAPLPQTTPDALYRQAMADYQQSHFDIAIKEFEAVVAQFPDSHLDSSAVFWQAQAHFNLKHYHRALALYDAVIHKYAESPKKATSYFKKGQVYERLDNRKLAIHNYRRVLELFPLEQQLDDLAKRRLSRLDE